ncbi:Endolytic peptidoglycan transglycosylase RlpA [Achromobacter deleyi]|uniref:Endolytic peptidoglycan transglycosylase RlpA n=1 Tax=Achromobacter deleyi TaxID=1353891 RepID=A0A6S6ZE91_9BURK|nr:MULTISPECIES: septal ring lytic transglycosylase RlpA family protein [Achromobacter]CAB3676021.1 Endolytic peptidoglycan transglycosylase RlpA [Achromobacter deleyi]CAB3838569.1 Endolytic peptidoglycan transglycosylase RlpA [Achromobacter deleyi]CAB3841342.1 Endolytic peptidoglycan transglycosylase RlpA [Achromobacter deleyi]CAB3875167.1 Endolytic peptidoglycan transglycosylase RlpA [Achromobacter deleyi]
MTLPRPLTFLMMLLLAIAVAGCSSTGGRKKGGGYYKDDGPDANPPSNLDQVPDAVPRIEPYASGANRPYVVFGQRYVPDTTGQPYKRQGIASWYGKKFHGNSTSIGEAYDMYAMTAAHTTLPIPSYARVTSLVNGKTIIVRVNDRGPFHSDRIMDLSYVAAYKLGIIGPGSGQVVVESIPQDEIRRLASSGAPAATPASAIGSTPVATPVAAAPISLDPQPLAQQPAPAPGSAPVRQPAAGGIGSVYLQVGAFSQPANAQSLVSRINTQLGTEGAPPASVEQSNNLYRVKIGPYPDRQSAMNAVQLVSDRIGITPSIAAQ